MTKWQIDDDIIGTVEDYKGLAISFMARCEDLQIQIVRKDTKIESLLHEIAQLSLYNATMAEKLLALGEVYE
jgi:hypothetical protein